MSTTVTYKGSTLTTVENATKTLKTAGKYMEGDVIITDSTSGGSAVVVTEETDAGGGIIKHITAVDLSNDTVTANVLLSGYTAHDFSGSAITGTYTSSGITPTGTINITTNGTHNVTNYAYASVSVAGGAVNNQNKSFTPDETGAVLSADAGYTGLGTVTIAGISSTYVGTGVARKSAADLGASGSVVTVPVGYYSSQVTKSISGGSAFPPAVTITKNPTISINSATGVVTATYAGSSSITPTVTAGYISQGTAGTVSTSGTSTFQLASKAAATYYTSTADQTITSNQWLVGVQTIKSVTYTGLTASTILSGTTVKIGDANNASRITQIAGTLSFQTYYSGSTAPSSSLGVNGDIYLQT